MATQTKLPLSLEEAECLLRQLRIPITAVLYSRHSVMVWAGPLQIRYNNDLSESEAYYVLD